MIRREIVPQTPAIQRGVPETGGNSQGRWAGPTGRSEGWGWELGELVCPLSWLLTKSWSHEQRPAEASDEV
jgi:hypothetical protein